MKDLSKEKRIEEELKRISVFYEEIAENKKAMIAPLLQNAAFMKITLEDLQEIINREGVTEVYQNGANQKGIKQSATLQSYNSVIKNYASVLKALSNYLPYKSHIKSAAEIAAEMAAKRKAAFEEEYGDEEERQRQLRESIDRAIAYQKAQREETLREKEQRNGIR